MSSKLPAAFVEKMNDLLGTDQIEPFMASYDQPRAFGIRVNTAKISIEDFKQCATFAIQPVPWAPEGFYYEEGVRPGKHPYYHAGLYYIQEPSAMAPVQLLDVKPGERVLDLCAAPGGKSTQIAAKLQGEGVLVVNDNHSDRVKALVKNLELFGVRNAVVLNEKPERMIPVFRGYFDKILIDGPCSGEGMFRKEEDMMSSWERHSVEQCSLMQRELLVQAAQMLAPGGRIVYSTCTFSPEENEAQIAAFLDGHEEFEVVPVRDFEPGRPDWLRAPWVDPCAFSPRAVEAVAGTARLWPHRLKGEGHFAAVLRRAPASAGRAADERPAAAAAQPPAAGKRSGREALRQGKGRAEPPRAAVSLEPLRAFEKELLRGEPYGAAQLVCYGEHAYASPAGLPELHGLKVVRPGWYIGALHRGRFEPSHALAMGLRMSEAKRALSFAIQDGRALRYLKGETLEVAESEIVRDPAGSGSAKGYCLVGIDGHPVGWGKWNDGMLKNEYPPGWRWT
ncbi:RsmB/NOP family class I SAM-dependent RNA methyltransferase [Paenibacillus hexagrammi]|uniref:RsmB/NOP family class I SAM-dependent RNA methyltransferase n=1 Tax=Paenibacillus hexagrammi TaxID=2908839 RepID=A0ABY3SDU3_9BACL|nr:RsmB/NOP family class I SAM-dependent RNA methyltransferase [Paenibacillus sp. YPD9-1]UJF31573.1 RsmB/NOP family class I SAM-dependent RNA methyltransferase [Paenibacillus sp. YPD9-1]